MTFLMKNFKNHINGTLKSENPLLYHFRDFHSKMTIVAWKLNIEISRNTGLHNWIKILKKWSEVDRMRFYACFLLFGEFEVRWTNAVVSSVDVLNSSLQQIKLRDDIRSVILVHFSIVRICHLLHIRNKIAFLKHVWMNSPKHFSWPENPESRFMTKNVSNGEK